MERKSSQNAAESGIEAHMRPSWEPLGGHGRASGSASVSKRLPRGPPRGPWKQNVWFYLGNINISWGGRLGENHGGLDRTMPPKWPKHESK